MKNENAAERSPAHRMLDAAVLGANVPTYRVNYALQATGDLAWQPLRPRRPVGAWERPWVPSPAVMRRAGPFDGLGAA